MSASQRNSSYNPLVARALRIRQQAEAAARERKLAEEARKEELREIGRKLDAEARERKIAQRGQENAERRAALAGTKRDHGRTLDQIETCYRQYTPAQLLPEHVTIDNLLTEGAVSWDGDTLVIKGRT